MSNKYIYQFCPKCKEEMWHRQFRRYGSGEKGKGKGKKSLRRIVTWCLACGYRIIDNKRKDKKRRVRLM